MVAADERNIVSWSLTAGQAGDAPEGRRLIEALGQHHGRVALLMDSAYQDNATRELTQTQGLIPVVPLRAECDFIESPVCSNFLFFRNFCPKTVSHFSEVALIHDANNHGSTTKICTNGVTVLNVYSGD